MSTRGINFLDKWIANNVPETAKADVISIHDAVRMPRLFKAIAMPHRLVMPDR